MVFLLDFFVKRVLDEDLVIFRQPEIEHEIRGIGIPYGNVKGKPAGSCHDHEIRSGVFFVRDRFEDDLRFVNPDLEEFLVPDEYLERFLRQIDRGNVSDRGLQLVNDAGTHGDLVNVPARESQFVEILPVF